MSSALTYPLIRVLVAEDEGLVAAFTRLELQACGFVVVGTAPDGRRAVELTAELRPSVVVMDIAMPEIDGMAAATEIQKQCPTPVVILSAHTDPILVAQATAAGVGAFVVKPPRADELARAITIAIARHADLMELRRLNTALRQSLAETKTLTGLLPICCGCKKIRDDTGYWNEVEAYIANRTTAHFSHGYCPHCLIKYFPDLFAPGETPPI
jgi:AmiR/NasT family two-component response regulator